jgi:cyclic pyranopterin phosphate synthase
MTAVRDSYQRRIRYLRVSITDRCNLRCVYCMPEEGIPQIAHQDILRFEEVQRAVAVAISLGITQVRLTGGEPLARRSMVDLVNMLAQTPGLEGLALTTNGTLLAPLAEPLAQAGLQRVNISLDTLRPERYRAMTRRGELADALAGIEAAQHAGLHPVKINAVVMRGINDDEVVDLARCSVERGWHVRFIEVMPLGKEPALARMLFVPAAEIRARIEAALGPLQPAEVPGNGPARTWRLAEAGDTGGSIGLISALSAHFCADCNRLRLSADGRVFPCLFSDLEIDLRGPLRAGADDEALRQVFLQAIASKGEGHQLDRAVTTTGHLMSRVGG